MMLSLAQKNHDFNKLDISRKFMIAGMCVFIIGLFINLIACILIAIMQKK